MATNWINVTSGGTGSGLAYMPYTDEYVDATGRVRPGTREKEHRRATEAELECLVRDMGGIASFPKTRIVGPRVSPFDFPAMEEMNKRVSTTRRNLYELPAMNAEILLPDGSILHLDRAGNYHIEDEHARVTYKANRIREFNPYMNASDLLEQFIKFLAVAGVLQKEVLQIPINVFIHWLIYKAAERDGDEVKDVPDPLSIVPQQFIGAPA